jgi:prepilin-type processing-associated H-X9-DG protein
MFLSGDRNIAADTTVAPGTAYGYSPSITVNAGAPSAGMVEAIGTNIGAAPMNNANFGWTAKMHQNAGNVGLADGSVQQYSMSGLKAAFAHTGDTTTPNQNLILFP